RAGVAEGAAQLRGLPVGLAAACNRQQVVQGAAGGGVEGLREARAAVLGHEALRVLGEAPRSARDAGRLTLERDGARPCALGELGVRRAPGCGAHGGGFGGAADRERGVPAVAPVQGVLLERRRLPVQVREAGVHAGDAGDALHLPPPLLCVLGIVHLGTSRSPPCRGRARDLGAPCWARLPHAWGGEPQRFGDVVVDLVVLERELFPRALLLVLLEAGAFELVQDEVADRLV